MAECGLGCVKASLRGTAACFRDPLAAIEIDGMLLHGSRQDRDNF
jgi:hypothetical protein